MQWETYTKPFRRGHAFASVEHRCLWCNRTFTGHPISRYCSLRCRRRAKWEREKTRATTPTED